MVLGSKLALVNDLLLGDKITDKEKMVANTVLIIEQLKLAPSCNILAIKTVLNSISFI